MGLQHYCCCTVNVLVPPRITLLGKKVVAHQSFAAAAGLLHAAVWPRSEPRAPSTVTRTSTNFLQQNRSRGGDVSEVLGGTPIQNRKNVTEEPRPRR